VVRTDGRNQPRRGDTLNLEAVPEHQHMFDAATGERLPT
jgi:hypothetical protein